MATHLIKKLFFIFSLWLGMAGLCACTSVPESTFSKPLAQPEDARPAPIRFSGLKNRLPVGAEVGVIRPRCTFGKVPLHRGKFNGIKHSDMEDALADMLEMQGYDVVGALNTVLDIEETEEHKRAEYILGAKLIGANADLCDSEGVDDSLLHKAYYALLPRQQGVSGRMYLEIEWALYDGLRRTVVYKATTKGYTKQDRGDQEGLAYLFNEAFSMAAHNLGADPMFHDLVFYGKKPSDEWRKKKSDPNEGRPRKFDAQEELIVKSAPILIEKNQDNVRKAADNAVLVQAGKGHGSGFFITKEGHILTNAHVVGDALRVRVVTSHKEEKLVAEVLRSDKARDVALLRLEEVPDSLKIMPSPIKIAWPAVSEDIYTIGAPARYWMQDTVTKGIVSAHRRMKYDGLTMKYIQGDVQVMGGNSGGPLLDAYGNVVGMSVANLYAQGTESNNGLNLFVPIEEALHYLDVSFVKP